MCRASLSLLALAGVVATAGQGCNPGNLPEPIAVAFTERWPTSLPTVAALKSALVGGTLTWTDPRLIGSGTTCEFVTDAQVGIRDVDLFGQQSGTFNFRFNWKGMAVYPGLTDGCDAAQNPVPSEILIESGANLALDETRNDGVLTLKFGNDTFTSDYHEVVLSRVNPHTRYIAGTFKTIATNHANPSDTRVLIINNGSFSAPH